LIALKTDCSINNEALTKRKSELEDTTAKDKQYIASLEKNVSGEFENIVLKSKPDLCVKIATKTKGDFTFLQEQSDCVESDNFSYDPIQQQIRTNKTKCIEAFNENDIILSECSSTSLKQRFMYYPLYDGKLKSTLYSKCLGTNADGLLSLQSCDLSNIVTKNGSIYLPNS
jgi:hypothetical protein